MVSDGDTSCADSDASSSSINSMIKRQRSASRRKITVITHSKDWKMDRVGWPVI